MGEDEHVDSTALSGGSRGSRHVHCRRAIGQVKGIGLLPLKKNESICWSGWLALPKWAGLVGFGPLTDFLLFPFHFPFFFFLFICCFSSSNLNSNLFYRFEFGTT
jgi:hypothetical protein